MALGKKRIVAQKSNTKYRGDVDDGGLGLRLGFRVRDCSEQKRIWEKKRNPENSISILPVRKISSKKLCVKTQDLEDLPQDILVRIICGVEHEDLEQLFLVSKTIREASLIAKQLHFAYTTPRKTSVFHSGRFGLDKPVGLNDDEIETPGAPLQKRYRVSLNRYKDDSGVSVTLFN